MWHPPPKSPTRNGASQAENGANSAQVVLYQCVHPEQHSRVFLRLSGCAVASSALVQIHFPAGNQVLVARRKRIRHLRRFTPYRSVHRSPHHRDLKPRRRQVASHLSESEEQITQSPDHQHRDREGNSEHEVFQERASFSRTTSPSVAPFWTRFRLSERRFMRCHPESVGMITRPLAFAALIARCQHTNVPGFVVRVNLAKPLPALCAIETGRAFAGIVHRRHRLAGPLSLPRLRLIRRLQHGSSSYPDSTRLSVARW